MKPVPIAVAAWILAAVGFCPPAQAVPQGLPHGMHAPAVPWLLRARYRRHRHYRRHDEQSVAATDADGRATDDSTIKPGQWEFAAQLEAAALAAPGSSAALGAASFGGGATKSTYAICVAADNAVPSAFVAGCELDAVHRDGGRITWSMTCTNPQNAVRSDGVAQYQGDTMTATMVSHLPSGHLPSGHLPSGHLPSGHLPSGQLPSGKTGDKAKGGKTIDVAQYITGRYLGPCPNTTTAAATTASAAGTAAAPIAAAPPAPAPANATGAAAAATAAVPPAPAPTAPPPTNATGSPAAPGAAARVAATPPPAAPTEGATSVATSPALPAEPETSTAARTEASEPRRREEHIARHRHYHRYRRHYAYRRRYRGAYGGGFYGNGTYSGFGPSPYSANGY
jgi:hypothetical protein